MENERNWIEMKKRNVIVVGLLSLSLLSGCSTNKIERSEQDIKQEKVEKAKKEIASENKREKASSTKIIIPNSTGNKQSESTQTESTQTQSGKYYWCCDDCGKAVCYEKCNEHNTPMTPEHMQLHLN